jgi:hypothetical protein
LLSAATQVIMLEIMFYLFRLEFLQGRFLHLAVLGKEINMKNV